LLYFFSDCIYGFIYYIIGYRKKTVRENLALALPHLSDKERLVRKEILSPYVRFVFRNGENNDNF